MEFLVFALMVLAFAILALVVRLPIGLALVLSSVLGVLAGGFGVPLRHLVEGSFAYLDVMLMIAAAMIFMKMIQANGLLSTLSHWIIVTFYRRALLLLPMLMLLGMLPAMLTGSSTAAVLSTGAIIVPVLSHLGFSRTRAAAFVAMAGVYGLVAPPVNIPGMIIAAGIDMPYIGLTVPMLLLALPLAVLTAYLIGLRHLRPVRLEELEENLPASYTGEFGWSLFMPLATVLLLMVAEKLFPRWFPALGLPLIFSIGSAVALFTGRPTSLVRVSREALRDALPVLGILVGVGMFIQVMTLTGARGALVVEALGFPRTWLYLAMGTGLPLLGAVSAFGSASVLGVPLALSLLGKPAVLVVCGLSLIASVGDLMPPTALAAIFAAQVAGEPHYLRVIKYCILPAGLTVLVGSLFIMFSEHLAWLV